MNNCYKIKYYNENLMIYHINIVRSTIYKDFAQNPGKATVIVVLSACFLIILLLIKNAGKGWDNQSQWPSMVKGAGLLNLCAKAHEGSNPSPSVQAFLLEKEKTCGKKRNYDSIEGIRKSLKLRET